MSAIFGGLQKLNWLVLLGVGGAVATLIMLFRKPRTKTSQIVILPQTEEERRYFRIRVKNLTGEAIRFGANLVDMDPKPKEVTLPLPMQITHEPDGGSAYIPAGEIRLVDVFRMFGPDEGVIEVQGAKDKPQVTKQEYALTIAVYRHGGASVKHRFVWTPIVSYARLESSETGG